jgi:hypothetical protein
MIIKTSLRVTKKHINKAVEESKAKRYTDLCDRCIIAQALKDMFPDKEVYVGYTMASVDKGKIYVVFNNHNAIRRITSIYDTSLNRMKEVKPTTLAITVTIED